MKRIYILILIASLIYPLSGQTLKIMPLGDSITKGYSGSPSKIGYRQLLYDNLQTNFSSLGINFVGYSNTSGGSAGYDHFEAHNGWQAVQSSIDADYNEWDMISHLQDDYTNYSDQLNTKLTHYNPDIVLLHVGTNDFETGITASVGVNHVNSVLDVLYSSTYNNNASNTVVFLAQIINRSNQVATSDPDAPSGIRATTSNFNNQLRTSAADRIVNNNNKIVLVNMETAITNYDEDPLNGGSGDMFDAFHPNQTGYNKIAGVWYTALSNYFLNKPSPIVPLNASNQTIPVTLVWGLTKNAVSYRVQVSENDNTFGNLIFNDGTGNITSRFVTLDNSNTNGFKSSTTYYWRVHPLNAGDIGSNSDVWSFTTPPLYVNAKIFLQGPYNGSGMMKTDINGILPLQDPYGKNEIVGEIPSPDIVDWVLVQIRTATTSGVASTATQIDAERAVFLKKDGTIVDINGTSPVIFSGVSFKNYYIVVKQRNHLAVMSNSALNLTDYTSASPFIFDNSDTYGTNAMKNFGDGNYGMYAGDANGNGAINATDYLIVQPNIGTSNGYSNSDLNLNGAVNATDYLIAQPNIGVTCYVP